MKCIMIIENNELLSGKTLDQKKEEKNSRLGGAGVVVVVVVVASVKKKKKKNIIYVLRIYTLLAFITLARIRRYFSDFSI